MIRKRPLKFIKSVNYRFTDCRAGKVNSLDSQLKLLFIMLLRFIIRMSSHQWLVLSTLNRFSAKYPTYHMFLRFEFELLRTAKSSRFAAWSSLHLWSSLISSLQIYSRAFLWVAHKVPVSSYVSCVQSSFPVCIFIFFLFIVNVWGVLFLSSILFSSSFIDVNKHDKRFLCIKTIQKDV